MSTPLQPLGAKLHQVWRYADVGMSLTDATQFNVDVEGLAWAPVEGEIAAEHFEEFQISLAHSEYLPDEYIDPASLFPKFPNSGLNRTYALNLLDPEQDPLTVVHERQRGYTLAPRDIYTSSTGTPLAPYPLNRGIPVAEHRTYTWRDTGLRARGAPTGRGVELWNNCQVFRIGTCGLMSAERVESIGLPLLMEFRCYPDAGATGMNRFDVSLAANSSARPNFRAFSAGGVDSGGQEHLVDPDNEDLANGGWDQDGNPTYGRDNIFYLGAMDLVTRVSRSISLWFDTRTTGSETHFDAPLVSPMGGSQPEGTQILLAYRGATGIESSARIATEDATKLDLYGDFYATPSINRDWPNQGVTFLGDDAWHDDISDLDGARYYQVRITFLSNIETAETPALSALGVAWSQ